MNRLQPALQYEDGRSRSRWRSVQKNVVVGAVTAAVLIAIGTSIALYERRQERILNFQTYRLQMETHYFLQVLAFDTADNGSPIRSSGQTLRTTLDVLRRDPYNAKIIREEMPQIASGKDFWGHPFVFSVSDDRRTVVLYSVGPNGKDEKGLGDDVGIRLCDPRGTGDWDGYPFSPNP